MFLKFSYFFLYFQLLLLTFNYFFPMCKILFLKWTNKQKAINYLDAFLKASSCDANLEKIAKEFGIPWVWNCHNHWWWFLFVTKDSINEYVSGKYFLDDKVSVKLLKEQIKNTSWEFLLMSEARVTDIGYVSALNSHPFRFISRNGYEWWLFYNGLLDYKELASLEKVDFWNYETKNWTTIMWISIAKALESGKSFKEAMMEPKKTLKSAYNAMFFVHDNTWKYKAYLHSFISKELFEKDYVKNHNSMIYRDDEDLFFAWNNSIKNELDLEFQSVENWQTFEFDIDFIEEYYFDGYK